jgi:hypothetical protein
VIVTVVFGIGGLWLAWRQLQSSKTVERRDEIRAENEAARNAKFTVAAALKPYEPPQDRAEITKLLSWRYQFVPDIVGGNAQQELNDLIEWVDEGPDRPSVRTLTGPGGVGKTQLACALVQALHEKHYRLTGEDDALEKDQRRLWIVDYPEESSEELHEIIKRARAWQKGRGRVLLLTRIPFESWRSDRLGEFSDILDRQKLTLDLKPREAEELFLRARETLLELYGEKRSLRSLLGYRTITSEEIQGWISTSPSEHVLPLYVLAAAIHCILEPELALTLLGSSVIENLAEREQALLRRFSRSAGFYHEAAARLSALATVAGNLSIASLKELSAPELDIGLTGDRATVIDRLQSLCLVGS